MDPNWRPPAVEPGQPLPADDGGGSATTAPGDGGVGGDGGSGGGDGGYDNVAACEALVNEIECGGMDLSPYIDCSVYADFACDVADYFNCVRDVVSCVDGVLDTSGIVECTDLASCA